MKLWLWGIGKMWIWLRLGHLWKWIHTKRRFIKQLGRLVNRQFKVEEESRMAEIHSFAISVIEPRKGSHAENEGEGKGTSKTKVGVSKEGWTTNGKWKWVYLDVFKQQYGWWYFHRSGIQCFGSVGACQIIRVRFLFLIIAITRSLIFNRCVFYRKPMGTGKALKLGSKSRDVESFVDQLKSEGERVAPVNVSNVSSNKMASVTSSVPANSEKSVSSIEFSLKGYQPYG